MSTNTPYSSTEIDFLRRVYPDNGIKGSRILFNEHFGTNLTDSQIKHRCVKNKIKVNHETKFQKGHISWNKGMSIKTERPDVYKIYIDREYSNLIEGGKKTWFKGCPIGTEKNYQGKTFIKIDNPSVWIPKGRYVYENFHKTKLKKNEKILYLNGDPTDCRIENLIKVTNKIIMRLNKQKLIFEDGELTRCAVAQQSLIQKIKEIENGNIEKSC